MIWGFFFYFLSKQGKPERKEAVGGEDTTKLSLCWLLTSADWCDQWVHSGLSCRRFVKWGAACLQPCHDLFCCVWSAGDESFLPCFVADPPLAPVPRCPRRSRCLRVMFYSGRPVVTDWTGWVCFWRRWTGSVMSLGQDTIFYKRNK